MKVKQVCKWNKCNLVATNYLNTNTPMCKNHYQEDRKTGIHFQDITTCCGTCSCCCKCRPAFRNFAVKLKNSKLEKNELMWIKNWVDFELEKLEKKEV